VLDAEFASIKQVPEVLKVTIPALIEQTLELDEAIAIVGIAPLEALARGV
jgi:hypothetical protein